MRIAITVDPYIPVPPKLYGGIERVADIAVRGMAARGHSVELFAHPDSKTPVPLTAYGVPPHTGMSARSRELWQLGMTLWRRRRDFDIVFSWGRLAALVPVMPYRKLAKVQCYCRDSVPWPSVRIAARIGGNSISFAGASASVYDQLSAQRGRGGKWHTLFFCAEMDRYTFVSSVPAAAPLAFLGRLERIKGVHSAIAIAKKAQRELIIAGNRVDSPEGKEYFEREIQPHLDDKQIRYIGAVDDIQKNALLGSCAALLFPIEWREAFGIVMAESMACGTPVIGYPCGSVPEVVRDGVNGFICRDAGSAVEALQRLDRIDRAAVRADCEARFSEKAFLDTFERILREAVNGGRN